MLCKSLMVAVGSLLLGGCSTVHKDSLSPDEIARIPPDQMEPVHQARLELGKAQDEVARKNLAVKSANEEVEVARHDVRVAQSQIERTKAMLSKANFDRNSQAGQQAQNDLSLYQAQLDAAQAHLKAANAAAELANAQKKEAEAQRDLAQARLELSQATALRNSGDPAGRNVNVDNIRGRADDRLKQVEKARSDTARRQQQADRERIAWQSTEQRYKQLRGVGGSNH